MSDGTGIALIVAGGVVALVTGFVLRTRLHAVVVTIVLLACGIAVGTGALVVQDHVTTAEWVITPLLASVLAPTHVRVLLGPFGPPRR